MKKRMKASLFEQWYTELKTYKKQILFSLLLFLVAGVLTYFSGQYTTKIGGTPVSDLILDHVPPMDLSFLYSYLMIAIIILMIIYPLIFKIKEVHNIIYYVSLITIVRAIFITFTHLKNPVGAIPVSFPGIFNIFTFQNDLFFSGHTALPLVGFLVFKSKIRYLFLAMSILMGATVLIMHEHYTIDVMSAFFIVYGTYHLGDWLKDKLDLLNQKVF